MDDNLNLVGSLPLGLHKYPYSWLLLTYLNSFKRARGHFTLNTSSVHNVPFTWSTSPRCTTPTPAIQTLTSYPGQADTLLQFHSSSCHFKKAMNEKREPPPFWDVNIIVQEQDTSLYFLLLHHKNYIPQLHAQHLLAVLELGWLWRTYINQVLLFWMGFLRFVVWVWILRDDWHYFDDPRLLPWTRAKR